MEYKVRWKQTVAEAGSSTFTTEYFKLKTSGTLRETKPLNETWGSDGISGIYSGTNANNLNGSYCVFEFPDIKDTEDQFDKWTLRQGTSNGQMNLRFMFYFGTHSRRQGFKWTGIEDTVVNSYNSTPSQPASGTAIPTSQISWLDPYIQNSKNIPISNIQNTPYLATFATELQINDLIFVPTFQIVTAKITPLNDENPPEVSLTQLDSVKLTWSEIKPEDKTPEGSLYQTYKNLFNNTFETIQNDETGKTIRYCAGVILTPYYGKSSYTYNPTTDTYTQGSVSSVRYGNREILGTTVSESGEYPASQSTPYLCVYYEQNIPELKGVYYGTSAGVMFGHSPSNISIQQDTFTIGSSLVTPTSDYSKLNNTNYNINPFSNYSGNVSYGGILSSITVEDSPVVVIPSIVGTSYSDKISSFVNTTTSSNANKYYDTGSNVIAMASRSRNFSPFHCFEGYCINDLWSTIMSYGCYVADAVEHAQIAPLGDKINGNNHIYCGNMDDNFVTDGTAKQGSDIDNLPQTKIGDIIGETPYNPVNPEGGGSDPDDDKTVKPNRVEGTSMILQTGRTLGSGLGFITMYNLDYSQIQTLGNLLWGSIADYDPSSVDPQTGNIVHNFYVQLGQEVTGTFDTSAILDYFVSLKQYPFSVGTLPITTAFGSDVYIGNGKVGIPIGSGVRILNSSIGLLQAGSCVIAPVTPYNDFKDYYNTTVTVYLPYCGSVELNPTEVINQTISCVYAIDFYTGECTAYLSIEGNPSYIIAVANGVIGVDIPLSSTADAQLKARHMIDTMANARLIQSGIGTVISSGAQMLAGNYAGGTLSAINGIGSLAEQGSYINAERYSRSGVASGYLSGGSGGASFFAPDSVYAIIRRGTYKRPDNYPHTIGYPLTKSGLLNTFSGFTVCANPDVSSLNCTMEEKNMIKNYLSNGVIV